MKKQIGLFFLFLNAFTLLAQHTDVGIRINSMQLNNAENYGISLNSKRDYETRAYKADVFIERINFKDILFRGKAGIFKTSSSNISYYNYSNGSTVSNSKFYYSEYFFHLA